jgi:hypothetical protein
VSESPAAAAASTAGSLVLAAALASTAAGPDVDPDVPAIVTLSMILQGEETTPAESTSLERFEIDVLCSVFGGYPSRCY